jgi:O-antigen/teichoic acid export membrane protein
MNTLKRVVKNTVVRTGAEVLNFALSAIFLIYVARHLGSEDFGKYSFALSFAALFIILTDMGLHTIFIREVAKEREGTGKLLGNILVIKFILAFVYFFLLYITINLMHYPHETKNLIYIMGFFVLGTSILDLFNSLFRAYERMEYEALIMFLNRLAVVIFGIITLYLGYGLKAFLIAILIANLLMIFPSSFLAFKKFSVPRFEMDKVLWRRLFKEAIPVGLMMGFTAIYLKIGIVILSIVKGNSAVGLYSAPHRLLEALIIFPTFFLAALFPVFTRFHKSSRDSLFKAYEGSFKLLLILILPIAVAMTVISDKFTIIIFGMEFIQSAIVLRILIWACLLMSLNTLLSYLIIAIGKQHFNIISFGISALTSVILNVLLIPSYSYVGTSLALVGSQIILFIFSFSFISSQLSRLTLHRIIIKPLLSSLILGGLLWYINCLNLFLLILIGMIFYFGILILLRTFSQEDILRIKSLFKLQKI